MRITKLRLAQMTKIVRERPEDCLVIPGRDLAEDGTILVTHNGVRTRLHRMLWERARTPLRKRALVRTCDTVGCQNPFHFQIPKRAAADRCRNGHLYAEFGELPKSTGRRCAKCYEIERGHPWSPRKRRFVCAHNHRLSQDNVYVYVDKSGKTHRRCKTCQLERVRAARALKNQE